ncbi:MAG: hypothetical protein VZR26_11585, partial [Erysipelotrichaceae bacterium]|nr:hypothetical protein [Erysipelotrichaceae bacterium]
MENKKKKKWPIILLVVLLLLGGGGCFAYFNNYLEPIGLPFKVRTEEETLKAEDPEPEEVKKEEVKVEHVQEIKRDYSNINGKWESEKRNNGQYLTSEIDYPNVINFNDETGSIEEKSIGSKYQYTVYLKDGYGRLKLFIKDLDGDSATIWYPNEEGKYSEYLVLTRTEKPAEVGQENTTEMPAQDNTATQQPKPSATSGSNTAGSGNTSGNSSGSGTSGKSGHYEERQVCVQEAYDEQVLVKKGACTDVLVKDAYDTEEMVYLDGAFYGSDMQEVYVCNGCGAVFYDA